MSAHRRCANDRRLPWLYQLSIVSCLAMLAVCVSCAKQSSQTTTSDKSSQTTTPAQPAAPHAPMTESQPTASTESTPAETTATVPAPTVPAPTEPAPTEPAPTEPAPTEPAAVAPADSGMTEPAPATEEKQVLRHAVFFQFKESATPEDVQKIVDAFRELPAKIDVIADFQCGTNNSPEGLNDGLTHCFLLTFKDEAGRAAYLPHEAHQAFGALLGPHLEKAFVIDYWGAADLPAVEKPLKHAVFIKFKDDASPEAVAAAEQAFAALPMKIDTIKAFEWGTNSSPEGLDDGFTHCFMVTFDSEEGRAAYGPHPEHQALVEVLKPVMEKVRVIDFWAEK